MSNLPLLTTLQSYFRALLILAEKTSVIYQAMIIGFIITIAIVWGAISYGVHGILAASLGLTIGQIVELLFLLVSYQKQNVTIIHYWQSIAKPSVSD